MMARHVRPHPRSALLAIVFLALAAGCTETETVYQERPMFNPPPDSVSGFMGYYAASTQQTTCGNCHVSYQTEWVGTAHADAYAALGGSSPSYCYGCHTVNGKGNSAWLGPDSTHSGYTAVPDPAYHDVQCESCHGPGYTHVSNPLPENRPYARAGIYGLDGTVKDTGASCGACHSGEHAPFVEQWAQTGHADSAANAYPGGGGTGCGASCHEGRTALARFNGSPSTYVEKDGPAGQKTSLPPATCAVCHDPHGSPYPAQLRLPIDAPDLTVNLCMSCHLKGATPPSNFSNSTASTTIRGSHSAQGPVLLGADAGWIPPGFAYDTNAVYTTHASTKNPRLCAGCHVNSFTVNDTLTGDFAFESVGHLFSPDPCLDPNGIPEKDNTCAYTPSTTRNWTGCTAAGCHASADVASSALINERSNVSFLANQLWNDLDPTLNAGSEPYMNAADGGSLVYILFTGGNPTVNGTQAFNSADNKLSVAEGALWNVMMLAENLYSHRDGSYGVHNPFFYEALLAASIQAVENEYSAFLPSPPSPEVKALMQKALSRPGVRYTPRSGQLTLGGAR